MKWLIKQILLQLLKDDYDIQMQVTKIANPELAYEIEKPIYPNRPPFAERHGWWNGDTSKPSYLARHKS